MKNKNIREQVFSVVKKIPRGKVATYGQIAEIIQSSKFKVQKYRLKPNVSYKFMPRLVGFCLHQNSDPNVPCHRVVDRNGRLAPNFGGPSLRSYGAPSKFQRSGAFDGAVEQRSRLVAEGVKFADNMHVDLAKSQWQ